MKQRLLQALVALILCICRPVPTSAAQTDSLFVEVSTLSGSLNSVDQPRSGEIRIRLVDINRKAMVLRSPATAHNQILTLNLFPDERFPMRVTSVQLRDRRFTFFGSIEGMPGSFVTIAGNDEAISGTVILPQRNPLLIEYVGGNQHRIVELDPRRQPWCGNEDSVASQSEADKPVPVVNGFSSGNELFPEAQHHPVDAGFPVSRTIDLLVVYTQAAMYGAGGKPGIEVLIANCIAQANQALRNSHVNAELQMAGSGLITYQETGSSLTDLNRLENLTDGHMDEVSWLRESNHADLVCLLVETMTDGFAGRANLLTSTNGSIGDSVFSVVRRESAAYLVFAHEIGHNLGCQHDRRNATTPGLLDCSYGYNFTAQGQFYGTVMSYPGLSIPYYSNPDVMYLGVATGVSQGSTNAADNAATIRASAPVVANYRSPNDLLYVVSTLAGSVGQTGRSDGVGTNALFSSPWGVAADNYGNVYVADTGNHTIRRITSDRSVSTLAGVAGQAGSSNGVGGDARFNSPSGLVVDTCGNVFVADTANHTVRKITPGGVVSTFAGVVGDPGSNDGIARLARFDSPKGVAMDENGNLFVTDSGNCTIRRVTTNGLVNTLAGQVGV